MTSNSSKATPQAHAGWNRVAAFSNNSKSGVKTRNDAPFVRYIQCRVSRAVKRRSAWKPRKNRLNNPATAYKASLKLYQHMPFASCSSLKAIAVTLWQSGSNQDPNFVPCFSFYPLLYVAFYTIELIFCFVFECSISSLSVVDLSAEINTI